MADDDLDILAWTMLGEAGGTGTQGMADVGHVVLNRVNSGRYGASIQDVALAPKQFSTWNSGAGGNDPKGKYPKNSPEFKRAREIAAQVVAGTIPGPPGKPLDYNAPSVSPYWANSKAQHGTYERNGHVFYPSVPLPPGELPEVATALATVGTPPAIPKRRPDSVNGLHPFDASTNTPRPNADGSVSTEVTRTVQLPSGEWVNVPSLWWGQGSTVRDFGTMGDDQLADFARRYEQSTGNAFPRYGSIPEAERAAIARSNGGGGTKAPITYPGNMVERSFAQLPKAKRYLSDEIGMSPVGGGKQTAPMFDAAYDERLGAMQLTKQPINSQGMAVGSSRPPAPMPKIPSPQLATQRARDPVLQAALNAKYPAQPLPPTSGIGAPPVTRPVQSVSVKVPPVPASVEERATARNRPIWQAQTKAETARLASLYANGGPTRPPAGPMTVEQMYAGIYPTKPGQFLIGSTDGLGPGNPNGKISTAVLTGQVNPQGLQVAQPMKPAPYPFSRPPAFPVTQMAQGKIAPVPFNRPTAVGTQLSVQPMPPMPIPRPPFGMGGGEMLPPFPATMGAITALRRSMPAFPTLRPPTSPAAQKVWMTGFSDSESSGGAHGGSDKDKHRGEAIPTNSRSY